jgi:hypothetical protein
MNLLTAIGLALPAGLNAYIPLLTVALAERFGILSLRTPYDALGSWWAIALIGALLVVEIVADKIPVVDHANDVVQTIVRPAAGALLAVGASGQVGEKYPIAMIAAGIIVAGAVHVAKATTRPAVNLSTAGMGAPVVSTAEDIGALGMSIIAIAVPALVGVVLVGLVVWFVVRQRRRSAAPPLRQ